VLFPGAVDFVRAAASTVPIAIASGALRHEIDEVIAAAGVRDLFAAIVASGDTPESKPSPAPYRLAFERLQDATGATLDPQRCVAIEDSRWGLESARGAGLRCVGVTNSYPADELTGAELVVNSLEALTIAVLHQLCSAEPALIIACSLAPFRMTSSFTRAASIGRPRSSPNAWNMPTSS
jgi:beta-phosphoglucomutase-like phosphatase (HAD superfamily)